MHSCEYSLLSLTEDWKTVLDDKLHVGILSTDMSYAFYSLQPSLLIQKLKAYGFSKAALNIMRAFFDKRRNRVKLAGSSTVSEWKDVVRGCPQGSSFGPLLWNIFQNDMAMTVTKSNLHMYADDHQLYKAGNQIKNIENELCMEAGIASDWYKENLLKPNYKKYQSMKLSPHLLKLNASSHDDFALRIDDHEIASSDSLKILGVNFDNTIDFSKHISDICIM